MSYLKVKWNWVWQEFCRAAWSDYFVLAVESCHEKSVCFRGL